MMRRLPAPRSSPAILLIAAFSTGLDFLFYLVYLAILVDRRLVHRDPPRPVRPRGRLRGQPAQRPRRRPDPGHLHAPQHEPDPEAVARGPQPDDAAGRPARPGDLRSGPAGERSWLVRVAARPARPLPDRAAPDPDRRPVRLLRGVGVGRPGRRASSSIRGSSALPLWRLPAAMRRGQPRRRPSGPSRRRRSRRPSGRGRRATASTGSTGGRPPATARSRSRSSSSSRPPTPGSSSTSTGRSRPAAVTNRRSRSAVRAAAAVADKAILENRAVGMTVNAHRTAILPADRGARQHLKIMQLLAAVDGDGATPLVETLVADRRPPPPGHDRDRHHRLDSTRPGSGRSPRSGRAASATVVVTLDAGRVRPRRARRARSAPARPSRRSTRSSRSSGPSARRALRHALAEYELKVRTVSPGQSLAEALVG